MDARGVLEHLAQHGTPATGVARRIDVGSERYLAYFEEELLTGFVARGASACRLYEGEYGAGKTHILQLIGEAALERGAAVVTSDLSQSLHLGDWRMLLEHILQNLELADSSGTRHRGLPNMLENFSWDDDELEALKAVRVPHSGFREAIYQMASGELPDHAATALSRFLLGESVTISYLRRSGIATVKGAVTDRNAERVLQTLGICLAALGITGLVILFDETEHTLRQRPGPREIRAANLMRRIIDGAVAGRLHGMFFAFAVLPGTIEQAALVYPALGQRIATLERSPGGYRRPVLQVSQLSVCPEPEEFLEMAIQRICRLAAEAGDPPADLPDMLRRAGRAVLESNASGFRRPLLKQLAVTAVGSV